MQSEFPVKVARLENIGILVNEDSVLGGYFLAKDIPDNCRIIDNRYNNKKRLNAPIYLEVYPSFLCNFRCSFCYLKLLGINLADSKQMSDETINATVKMCDERGINTMNILGGEPLHPLNWPTTRKLIERAHEKGIRADITTNGFFLTEEIVDFLKKNQTKLNLSLQSLQPENSKKILGLDPSQQLKNIILNIVDGKIRYGLSTAILKTNINEIEQLIDFVNNLSTCGAWVWRYVTVFGDFDKSTLYSMKEFFDIYNKYKNKIKKNVYFDAPFSYKYLNIKPMETDFDAILSPCCNPGESKAEVLPDGTVYSCILFYGDEGQIMGNVNQEVNFTKTYGYKREYCSNSSCAYSTYCTGCPAYANRTGVKFDDRCEYARKA
ncbi:MAG: radical SAM protein [Candidatus Micrarchaeia archaeon]